MAREPRIRRTYLPNFGGEGRTEMRSVGAARDGWRDIYHHLLTMPLAGFFGVFAAVYLIINTVFAMAYLAVGGVENMRPGNFADAFFFSAETISTVGYGDMEPRGFGAHVVVTAEGFIGIFNLALAAGLLVARVARPTARVLFSDRAVITQHEGQRVLMLRAANERRNRLVEAEVSMNLLHWVTTKEGDRLRRFETMAATRSRTPVFMLTWQITHPIDELSPLLGETPESLAASEAQVVVVLRGLDETFAQTVHARAAYDADQIVWNGKFVDIFREDDEGRRVIDYAHFHDIA